MYIRTNTVYDDTSSFAHWLSGFDEYQSLEPHVIAVMRHAYQAGFQACEDGEVEVYQKLCRVEGDE